SAVPTAALQAITVESIKAHLTFLGDDLLGGRVPGTAGYDIAARYVAAEFASLGLEAAGINGGYFQPVPVRSTIPHQPATNVAVEMTGRPMPLRFGADYVTAGNRFDESVDITAPLASWATASAPPSRGTTTTPASTSRAASLSRSTARRDRLPRRRGRTIRRR